MKVSRLHTIVVLVAIAITLWFAIDFGFYQDDAYISYRYVSNYLDGHGLVFNLGERVEGYTNFGWVLYLLFCGILGLDIVLASKVGGLVLAAVLVWLVYLVTREVVGKKKGAALVLLVPPVLVAFNRSFAYWSQAGLETAAFAVLSAWAVYLFLRRSWLLIAALTLAVLIRPEGALVAALLIIIEWVIERRRPSFSFSSALSALVLSLPFVAFKFFYYGSILPNPFYAKTGFDLAQIEGGVEYAVRFFQHYPALGVGLLLALVLWRSLSKAGHALALFCILYLAYIVLVGGDVLKVHRFFVPLIGMLAVLFAGALSIGLTRLRRKTGHLVVVVLGVGLIALSLWLPSSYIDLYAGREKVLTNKMIFLARSLRESDRTDFAVAVSTIGAFSYYLPDHRIIDLLGLTDSVIARHPETPPPGIESTWRERGFNSPYVLQQAPEYIVFSTGAKPSAPAERALVLYTQFQDCYRAVSWHYDPPKGLGEPVGFPAFKKWREPRPPFVPAFPAELVNSYNDGVNAFSAGYFNRALGFLDRAIELGGSSPYIYAEYFKSLSLGNLRRYDDSYDLQNQIVARDSFMYEPHADLYITEFVTGYPDKAAIHRRWLQRLVPWRVPGYDSTAAEQARAWQAERRRRGGGGS